MSNIVQIYPRGYSSIRTTVNPTFVNSDGDETLSQLYRLYVSRSVNTDSWEFRKRVIACVSPFFGELELWFSQQYVENNFVYGLNFEFLQDTLRFIRTGKREMSVLTWLELVLDNPKVILGSANRHRLSLVSLTPFEQEDFKEGGMLARWLSYPSGFDDLVMSSYLLFGEARPIATARATHQGGLQQRYV